MRTYTSVQTKIGNIFIVMEEESIAAVHIGEEDFSESENIDLLKYDDEQPLLLKAAKQLEEYFSGERKEFDLPLREEGTAFQTKVWKELQAIPYGETRSYQDVAIAIGNKKAVRAIGQANKANKLPILIPCHRVIGKDKTLTGYAGKRINIKEELLLIEGSAFKR